MCFDNVAVRGVILAEYGPNVCFVCFFFFLLFVHRFRTRVRVFRAFSSARLKNEKKKRAFGKNEKKTRV